MISVTLKVYSLFFFFFLHEVNVFLNEHTDGIDNTSRPVCGSDHGRNHFITTGRDRGKGGLDQHLRVMAA